MLERIIYKKNCLWCDREMTRTKRSEAMRPNWRVCSGKCRRAFRNCISCYGRRIIPMEERIKRSLAIKGKPRPAGRLVCGERHWNWQGGKTAETIRLRNSARTKDWRKAVFERDNYTCLDCGARNGNGYKVILNADHIKPWAYYPELRYDVSNGRTLCLGCHTKTPTFGYKAFMAHAQKKPWVWGKLAASMGDDLATEAGNLAFGKYLFDKYGAEPWSPSKKCWE